MIPTGAEIITRHTESSSSSRKPIDVAIGVLVGVRGCTEADAFEEIAQAVHATGVGLGRLAHALVLLASGTGEPFPHRAEATSLWGHLMAPVTTAERRA